MPATAVPSCSSDIDCSGDLLEQAWAWIAAGQIEKGRVAFTRAIEDDATGMALNAFGCFLCRTGYWREAAAQFQRLLALADQLASSALRSVACNNLACVFRESGELTLAALWQQRSWEAAQSDEVALEPHADLGCDLGNRANDAVLAGDFHLAEQLFRSSLEWETTQGTAAGQAADRASLGVVAALQGHWRSAMGHFRSALRLHVALGDERGAGCDLLHLGQLWAELGRWRPAVRSMERALWNLERAGASRLAMKARGILAETKCHAQIVAADPLCN